MVGVKYARGTSLRDEEVMVGEEKANSAGYVRGLSIINSEP